VLDALKTRDRPRAEQHQADPFADNLPPNDPVNRAAWQRWFNLLVRHKFELGNAPTQHVDGRVKQSSRTLAEAHTLALGEAVNLWHIAFGQRPDPHLCAGCDGPIGSTNIFAVPDGARVHDDAGLACLHAYGHRWRTTAEAALQAMGITPDV
jgi:hypothetical protein